MSFQQIGQDWRTYTPNGTPKSEAKRITTGQWCWVERLQGESELCPVGEVVTIEAATRLEDDEGNEIQGGLDRAALWETIAKRRGLPIPKQPVRRKTKRVRKTKAA